METIDIKGKPYVLVNERLKYFRENFKNWALETEVLELNPERCVLKAVIKDEEGRTRATGLAYELASSSYINKTSYIENCETSAWGRALGNLGIGIDTSVASAEEVQTAISNQERIELEEKLKKANEELEERIRTAEKTDARMTDSLYQLARSKGYSVAVVNKTTEKNTGKKDINDLTIEEFRSLYEGFKNCEAKR
jgi:hypothetical protein